MRRTPLFLVAGSASIAVLLWTLASQRSPSGDPSADMAVQRHAERDGSVGVSDGEGLDALPQSGQQPSTVSLPEVSGVVGLEIAGTQVRMRADSESDLGALRFRLEDDRGEAIVRAAFTYHRRSASGVRLELESSTGDYQVGKLAPGEWFVAVTAEAHAPVQHPDRFDVGDQDERVLLRFTRKASIAGRVLDSEGVPVAGIGLSIAHDGPTGDVHLFGCTVDDQGAFATAWIPPGPVQLRVTNGIINDEFDFTLAPGEVLQGVDLRLTGGGVVRGDVRDAAGLALEGISVVISDASEIRLGTKTDGQGTFRLGPILPGSYHIFAALKVDGESDLFDQLLSETFTIASGEVLELHLQPEAETPIVLSGRVTCAGEPLVNCVCSTGSARMCLCWKLCAWLVPMARVSTR